MFPMFNIFVAKAEADENLNQGATYGEIKILF